MDRMSKRTNRSAAAIAVLLLLFSCTGQPPEIARVFWQLNIVEDREQDITYQSLSVFLKPNDPDGFDDIEDLHLIHDEQELFWRLDGESWAQSGSEGDIWIGSNALKMPDGASFPAGEYRILLRDIGGDSAEQTISLRSIPTKQAQEYLPEVAVDEATIRISGKASPYEIWIYDAAGRYLSSLPVSDGMLRLDGVASSQPELSAGFNFKVYGFVDNRNLGVLSGPYYSKP